MLTGFLHGLSHINQMTTDCESWIWYHKWLFCTFTILCTFITLLVLISHSSDSNDLIRVKIQAFKRERQVAKLEGRRGETIPIPNCVVCTEPIQSTQPIALDPCGHTNCCWRCALTIEIRDGKCPTCRKRFDKIMPLYTALLTFLSPSRSSLTPSCVVIINSPGTTLLLELIPTRFQHVAISCN